MRQALKDIVENKTNMVPALLDFIFGGRETDNKFLQVQTVIHAKKNIKH